jgi:hypothetical protein
MPLSLSTLKSSLENNWLVPEGGSYPATPQESADRFATAVASWFSTAQASGFPCSTAQARKAQLSSQLTLTFQQDPGSAASAAQGIADALSLYIAGQLFGAGVASPPVGTAAASSSLVTTFSNLELDNSTRAQQIALACQTLALTTAVIFPSPLPPGTVT